MDTIINWLKLSPKYLFVIFLLTGILLFAPESFIEKMGMDLFINDHRKILGPIFLAAGSMLIVTFSIWVYKKTNKARKQGKALKLKQERLSDLTLEEKTILSSFIFGETRTQILPITDGVVSGLVSAKIIYRSAGTIRFPDCAFNIQPWAWDYLNLFPHLLDENYPRI